MTRSEPLSHCAVAISISESPDMGVLGLGMEHLEDAMTEVARHLLALGARLLYGGDLREGGFSRLLFELVARHRRNDDLGDKRVGVSNYLAWPVHAPLPAAALRKLAKELRGTADLVLLEPAGKAMSARRRQAMVPQAVADADWADGLTAMRRTMLTACNARVVLGGRVEGYKGRMPGIAEEALLTLEGGRPLYVLGGFGGCARDVGQELRLLPGPAGQPPSWAGRDRFAAFSGDSLLNGLTREENRTLASTPHIDQAVALILRGLLRREQAGDADPGAR